MRNGRAGGVIGNARMIQKPHQVGMPARSKAYISWSTGKDSAYALHEARRQGIDVVGMLTTVTSAFGRVSMHGVRETLLDRQVEAVGLPCLKIAIPTPCSTEIYEQEMGLAMAQLRADGVTAVVFGDLFLADLRADREAKLAAIGMTGIFPLWLRDTSQLAHEMIASGVRATLTCIDPRVVPRSLAGRAFDETLLADLPASVDRCGENGEFHTFVSAGPMLRYPLDVRGGEVVEREGFVFADLL